MLSTTRILDSSVLLKRSGVITGVVCSLAIGIVSCQQTVCAADAASPDSVTTGTAAAAQKFGVISGKVQVAKDLVLTNGRLILTAAHGERLEFQIQPDGVFRIEKLKPGRWTVVATGQELLSQTKTIEVAAGETADLQFTLHELEADDALEVKDKRNLRHERVTSDTTFIDKRIIEDYRSGNNLRDVVATAPGVSQDSFGNMVVRGEHNTVNYVLDDVVLPEAVGQLQQGQIASPHSLESVHVTVGGYQASQGGGPMGAIVNMQSMPIQAKPTLTITPQLGGPMQGGVNYYASSALSQDANSRWNHVRVESSGQIFATKLGVEPPTRHFTRNGRLDINILNKVEWTPTERDRFRLTASINQTWMHLPTPFISRRFGFKQNLYDRQNYIILSHRHLYDKKWIDESNLHVVTGFYSQRLGSTNRFNPEPIINGEEQSYTSASPTAKRFNFAFSAQGDVRKTLFQTHHLKAGFYSEIRPVRTYFSSYYYDAAPNSPIYGQLISPFTGVPVGPQLLGNVGKYRGFRYLQSAYLQDTWTPKAPVLKRLTLDAGVRLDVYHGVFGNTRNIATAIAPYTVPGMFEEGEEAAAPEGEEAAPEGEGEGGEAAPEGESVITGGAPVNNQFLMKPFQTNRVTNAQVSGRFGASYQLGRQTVVRGSFAQIFTPPPVDLIPRPFNITEGTINGIYDGSLRPMQATRGYIVDTGLEHQVGPRLDVRASMYYKHLKNIGDELPVNNTLLYQRLTLAALEGYGVESRIDLKPSRDGTGFFGFLSNTLMVAKLGGNHKDSGGIYDIDPAEVGTAKYIDHDRRESLSVAIGYRSKKGFWAMADMNYWTGFLIGLDPMLFGAHRARTKPFAIFDLNIGYDLPAKVVKEHRWAQRGFDVRIQNISNNIVPINQGSPFQGTRYTLPIRVLAESRWTL